MPNRKVPAVTATRPFRYGHRQYPIPTVLRDAPSGQPHLRVLSYRDSAPVNTAVVPAESRGGFRSATRERENHRDLGLNLDWLALQQVRFVLPLFSRLHR
jgi:hypothetical protein